MDLLFKREQTPGKLTRVNFKLWGKLEFTEDERALVDRYHFEEACLIEVIQPYLLRQAILAGIVVFIIIGYTFTDIAGAGTGVLLGLIAGGGAGYWWANEKRETIFVKDLMHGRNFKCDSVVELARKEAWLEYVCGFLRQVMESAKHWDGVDRHKIEPLPKDEARQVILKGL